MTFIPMPNCCKLEAFYTANGQSMENVFHVQGASPFDDTSLAAAIAVLQGWLSADWAPNVGADIACVGIKATALDDDSSPTATATLGEPISGGYGGELIPMSSNAVVSWRTNLRGRSFRGRTYHVGITESQQNKGELTPTALGLLTTAYQHLLDAWEASVFSPVIVSLHHNKAPRVSGEATLITGFQLHAQLRSQRRRNVGIGG